MGEPPASQLPGGAVPDGAVSGAGLLLPPRRGLDFAADLGGLHHVPGGARDDPTAVADAENDVRGTAHQPLRAAHRGVPPVQDDLLGGAFLPGRALPAALPLRPDAHGLRSGLRVPVGEEAENGWKAGVRHLTGPLDSIDLLIHCGSDVIFSNSQFFQTTQPDSLLLKHLTVQYVSLRLSSMIMMYLFISLSLNIV